MVSPGVSTLTLEDTARQLIAEGGDEASFLNYTPDGAKRPYPAGLCVSINDEIVHGIPNENPRTLEEGDIVTLDLGLTHKGLITDMAITVPVGKVSKEDKLLVKATREAMEAGIKAAQGGRHIGDIGAEIEKVARKYNFNIADGLAGHGVGYEVHEDPYVPNTGSAGEGPELKAGMVLAVEPMLVAGGGAIKLEKDGYTITTQDGKKSAHFEKTICITEGKPLVLTP
jgi:methionyl aminopeptidase